MNASKEAVCVQYRAYYLQLVSYLTVLCRDGGRAPDMGLEVEDDLSKAGCGFSKVHIDR